MGMTIHPPLFQNDMLLLIPFAFFVFIVYLTATICVQRGWSVWVGIALGIFLQPVGSILGTLVGLFALPFGDLPFAISWLVLPWLGAFLPAVIASLLHKTSSATVDGDPETQACADCGRVNAVTTTICPRCGTIAVAI